MFESCKFCILQWPVQTKGKCRLPVVVISLQKPHVIMDEEGFCKIYRIPSILSPTASQICITCSFLAINYFLKLNVPWLMCADYWPTLIIPSYFSKKHGRFMKYLHHLQNQRELSTTLKTFCCKRWKKIKIKNYSFSLFDFLFFMLDFRISSIHYSSYWLISVRWWRYWQTLWWRKIES